jgi:hypothetical protein
MLRYFAAMGAPALSNRPSDAYFATAEAIAPVVRRYADRPDDVLAAVRQMLRDVRQQYLLDSAADALVNANSADAAGGPGR